LKNVPASHGLLRRIIYKTNTLSGIIAGIGIAVLVFLTGVEVVKRYFLNSPSSWAFEVSEYLMVFGAFLGMAYAMQVSAHVAVDVIYLRYRERNKRIADLIVAIFSLFFWALLTGMAYRQALIYLARNVKSSTLLAVPQFYPMMLVVIGSLICCFQGTLMIYDAVMVIRGKRARDSGAVGMAPVQRGKEGDS